MTIDAEIQVNKKETGQRVGLNKFSRTGGAEPLPNLPLEIDNSLRGKFKGTELEKITLDVKEIRKTLKEKYGLSDVETGKVLKDLVNEISDPQKFQNQGMVAACVPTSIVSGLSSVEYVNKLNEILQDSKITLSDGTHTLSKDFVKNILHSSDVADPNNFRERSFSERVLQAAYCEVVAEKFGLAFYQKDWSFRGKYQDQTKDFEGCWSDMFQYMAEISEGNLFKRVDFVERKYLDGKQREPQKFNLNELKKEFDERGEVYIEMNVGSGEKHMMKVVDIKPNGDIVVFDPRGHIPSELNKNEKGVTYSTTEGVVVYTKEAFANNISAALYTDHENKDGRTIGDNKIKNRISYVDEYNSTNNTYVNNSGSEVVLAQTNLLRETSSFNEKNLRSPAVEDKKYYQNEEGEDFIGNEPKNKGITKVRITNSLTAKKK